MGKIGVFILLNDSCVHISEDLRAGKRSGTTWDLIYSNLITQLVYSDC